MFLPCSGVEELGPGQELVVREFETSGGKQQGKKHSRGGGSLVGSLWIPVC